MFGKGKKERGGKGFILDGKGGGWGKADQDCQLTPSSDQKLYGGTGRRWKERARGEVSEGKGRGGLCRLFKLSTPIQYLSHKNGGNFSNWEKKKTNKEPRKKKKNYAKSI